MIEAMVLGFCFDPSFQQVVLLRKNRPKWQEGRLNGIGGHIEKIDASEEAAMTREFGEETGVWGTEWRKFGSLAGPEWTVQLFVTTDDRWNTAASMTDEEVGIYNSYEVAWLTTISNLRWLVPLAIDFMREDGQGPGFVCGTYHTGQ